MSEEATLVRDPLHVRPHLTRIRAQAQDEVVTKYKLAAEIVNKTLAGLIKAAVPGKTTLELCKLGDILIKSQTDAVYKNKKNEEDKPIQKGTAFPTCISLNDCVCHNSPLESEVDAQVLKEGDVVKIDLGCHIDGFPALAAHTLVVGEAKATGKAADVCMAALHGAHAALKTIQVGATNYEVTRAIKQVADAYGVQACQGVLMHQMKRFIIDSNNTVILREEADQRVETFAFEAGNVYTVDVVMSTGAGKPAQRDAKTTVFKRNPLVNYQLKMKTSRVVFSEISKDYPTFPFSMRQLSDEKSARLAVKECLDHELLVSYPVLFEKPGDLVAHFKFTVLVMPSGNVSMGTGLALPLVAERFASEVALPQPLLDLVNREDGKKKAKKKEAEAVKA